MSDDARPVSKVGRRTLIAGAAWAVPTVAVLSATPAFAASSGALTISSVAPWNLKLNGKPGPIGFNLQIGNYSSGKLVNFTYTVTVLKPNGQSDELISSTASSVAAGATWQVNNLTYKENGKNLPAGAYTVIFAVTSGSYHYSTSGTITI